MPEWAGLGTWDKQVGHVETEDTEEGFRMTFRLTATYRDTLRKLRTSESLVNQLRAELHSARNRIAELEAGEEPSDGAVRTE